MGDLKLERLRTEVEPLRGDGVVAGMEVGRGRRVERVELAPFPLDAHVVDTDGLDADVLDVGPKVLEVADGVRLDDLRRGVVEADSVSGCEVVHRSLLLRDRDEVQHELLGEDAAVVEPCVGEALVAEALDRIGEDTDPGVVVEIAQMAVRVE